MRIAILNDIDQSNMSGILMSGAIFVELEKAGIDPSEFHLYDESTGTIALISYMFSPEAVVRYPQYEDKYGDGAFMMRLDMMLKNCDHAYYVKGTNEMRNKLMEGKGKAVTILDLQKRYEPKNETSTEDIPDPESLI